MALRTFFHPAKIERRWEVDDRVYVQLPGGGVIDQRITDVCDQIMVALDNPASATEHRVALLRAMAGEENWRAALEIHRQTRAAGLMI